MAIARQVGGSVENFVQMMNDKAASLAMTGTHFANPHGLHDENHYTTAYDVYLMLYAAYQHTEFQNTMSMSSYTLNMTHADGMAGTIYLSSTDKYLTGEKNAPENVTVLGGKPERPMRPVPAWHWYPRMHTENRLSQSFFMHQQKWNCTRT